PEIRKIDRVGLGEKILRVKVPGDLVEASSFGEDDARELEFAKLYDRFSPAHVHGETRDVDARHHRVTRVALRKAHDPLDELALRVPTRPARRVRREDAEDLLLAERALRRDVFAHPHRAKDDARRALEDPEERPEREVNRTQWDRHDEGGLLG